jgi:SAM-dependent methyltransferase
MARTLKSNWFDPAVIYASQPDAVVYELGSLEEWLELTAQCTLHDLTRNTAIIDRTARYGLESVHFGHVSKPEIVRAPFADIAVEDVGNCQRAVLDLMAASRFEGLPTRVYAAEALSPFARALRTRYPKFLGSQYAPDAETQRRIFPINHQDLMQLTLPDASFDVVLSIEVLEHIPFLSDALSEMARILVPGGLMLSTFPFLWDTTRTVRKAELVGGEVRHLVEKPEIHGNPMSPDGALVFQIPGWDIIQMARDAGFRAAKFVFYSSAIGGIIGVNLTGRFVFVCER